MTTTAIRRRPHVPHFRTVPLRAGEPVELRWFSNRWRVVSMVNGDWVASDTKASPAIRRAEARGFDVQR